jgi:glycosyltransferase involved in cell wall biosynthesis
VTRPRPRAVILTGNPANPYSRAIRLGRTLVANGYDVEIAAPAEDGAPELEHDGQLVIRRYMPSGRWAGLAPMYQDERQRAAKVKRRPWRLVYPMRVIRARLLFWTLWPQTIRGHWHTLKRELEPADVYHACGVLPIKAALAARERDRQAGRRSSVIADVIDFQLDSNNSTSVPRPVRALLRRRERRWFRAADAHVAVNEVFAARAQHDWNLREAPVVVPNYPEPWAPPAGELPDIVRQRLGLAPTTRICLFWGRLGHFTGLDAVAEAVLLVPDTALVVLGFGRGKPAIAARDSDPRFLGRHFTLPAVHPDELPSWIASADVALMTLPPTSYNQRYTTPNKFLEALGAGVPMVLGPDLPTTAEILEREDAGRIAASMAPEDIATAIRSILDVPTDERNAWRQRLLAVARKRYSWPIAARAYETVLRRVEANVGRQATSTVMSEEQA